MDPEDVERKGEWQEGWQMAAAGLSTCEIEGEREGKDEETHLNTETKRDLANRTTSPSQHPYDDQIHVQWKFDGTELAPTSRNMKETLSSGQHLPTIAN